MNSTRMIVARMLSTKFVVTLTLCACFVFGQNPSGKMTSSGDHGQFRDPGPPPCCEVTKVDDVHHTATAVFGNQSFVFAIPCVRTRQTVSLGQHVWANFKTGGVSLDGRQVCSQMVAQSVPLNTGTSKGSVSGSSQTAKHEMRENFSCDGENCTCFGDADCNNMFSSGVCRVDGGVCSGPAVMCQCRQQTATGAVPNLDAAPGEKLTVVSLENGQLLARGSTGKQVRAPVSSAFASRLKAGDELTVRAPSKAASPKTVPQR
jgi:hypothetical protein